MKIKISDKWIGGNNPVFVVAEAGINHNGNVRVAKMMIEAAKKVGVDAIKFQTFKASDFTTPKSKYYKIFKKVELSYEDFGELADQAKSNDIIFFSTPSSQEAVDVLHKLNVPAFKIASGDLTNIPLLEYIAVKKRPMIISTGLANMREVFQSVNSVEKCKNRKIILMHSVSTYPAPHIEANLKVIPEMGRNFDYPIGYSDNGDDFLVPSIAVAVGAKIIEKHFTLNKKMIGPDHMLSADPKQFKDLINDIRKSEAILGDGIKRCQPSELKNIVQIRKSLTAAVTIEKNSKLKYNMIGIKRPALGIEPRFLKKVLGRITIKKINKNEPIRWSDIR